MYIDVDECETGKHTCAPSKNKMCENRMPSEGLFSCVCKDGFKNMSDSDICEGKKVFL